MVFSKLFSWARNRKAGAIVFGALMQMFMPDPYVERTLTVGEQDKNLLLDCLLKISYALSY